MTKAIKTSSRSKSGGKARTLFTLMICIVLAFILAGQSWYAVTMSPNDEVLTLQNFDGFTSYAWLAPMLLVCLALVAATALLAGFGLKLLLVLGCIMSSLIAFLVGSSVVNQDLRGVSKQLENATGIAATHGITGLGIQTSPFAYLSIVLLGIIFLVFLYSLIAQRDWMARRGGHRSQELKRAATTRTKAASPASKSGVKDSIGLWDEQR